MKNVGAFVFDGASVNKAAARALALLFPGIIMIWCNCHQENLFLQDCGEHAWAASRLKRAREIVRFLGGHGRSHKLYVDAKEEFNAERKSVQEAGGSVEGDDAGALKLPANTRFGTNILMVVSVLNAEGVFDVMLQNSAGGQPSPMKAWIRTLLTTVGREKIPKRAVGTRVVDAMGDKVLREELQDIREAMGPAMKVLKMLDRSCRSLLHSSLSLSLSLSLHPSFVLHPHRTLQ